MGCKKRGGGRMTLDPEQKVSKVQGVIRRETG